MVIITAGTNNMQSILFLSVMNGAAWGGSEELWYQSALRLTEKGYSVGICLFNWPGKKEKIKTLEKAGCKVYLLPGKKETKTILGKWRLRNAFKKVPFSSYQKIIINQGGWKDIAYYPFKTLHKTLPGYCLSFHNYDTDEKLSAARKRVLQKWINSARINIAASKKVFETLKTNFDIEAPKQRILINSITFYPPEEAFIYPSVENKIIFVMVAALDVKRKAQDKLIKALSKDKWKQRNWELHLYGEGHDKEMLENIIAGYNLQSKVMLKGFTNDVKKVIAPAHLLLQITNKDAMPISVMEAMAVGRPVIASNVGDMPEWISHDENGWIINNLDEKSVDETLEHAWNYKSKWEMMGKNAFAAFHKRYPADPVDHFLQQCELL